MLTAADLSLPAMNKVHGKMTLRASLGLTACATEALQACKAAATVQLQLLTTASAEGC